MTTFSVGTKVFVKVIMNQSYPATITEVMHHNGEILYKCEYMGGGYDWLCDYEFTEV